MKSIHALHDTKMKHSIEVESQPADIQKIPTLITRRIDDKFDLSHQRTVTTTTDMVNGQSLSIPVPYCPSDQFHSRNTTNTTNTRIIRPMIVDEKEIDSVYTANKYVAKTDGKALFDLRQKSDSTSWSQDYDVDETTDDGSNVGKLVLCNYNTTNTINTANTSKIMSFEPSPRDTEFSNDGTNVSAYGGYIYKIKPVLSVNGDMNMTLPRIGDGNSVRTVDTIGIKKPEFRSNRNNRLGIDNMSSFGADSNQQKLMGELKESNLDNDELVGKLWKLQRFEEREETPESDSEEFGVRHTKYTG